MKPTDIEKRQGKKVVERMRKAPASERYGAGSATVHDRRDQRRREQAAGLVPFAVKLPADLVAALQERARVAGQGLNDVTEALLREALDAPDAIRKADAR